MTFSKTRFEYSNTCRLHELFHCSCLCTSQCNTAVKEWHCAASFYKPNDLKKVEYHKKKHSLYIAFSSLIELKTNDIQRTTLYEAVPLMGH